MFVKNNLVNRGYCLFQSYLNRFSLPCGRFSPKHEILHFPLRKADAKVPPHKANAKLSPRKANAKLPPRALRKSKPESPMSLKASPKPQCPYKISALKRPCSQLRCRRRNRHSTLLRRARPTARLLPLAQDPETPLRLMKQGPGRRSVQSAANPSAHGLPPNPIRQGPGAASSDQWP